MPSTQQDSRNITVAYVAPFVAFVGIMAIEKSLSIPPQIAYPVRFCMVWAIVLIFSRRYLKQVPSHAMASIGIGLAVFVIWIAPDLLFDYRHSILFTNSVIGSVGSSISTEL